MQSVSYIKELNKIKLDAKHKNWKKDLNVKLQKQKAESVVVEATVATESILRTLFDERNVDDDLAKSFSAAFANSDMTLNEHYLSMVAKGPASVQGFVSSLKGKLFELKLEPALENKYPGFDFSVSDNPTTPIWDLIGENSETGEQLLVQAKMGASSYASDVLGRMKDAPDVKFALSDDLAAKLVSIDPAFEDQIITMGGDSETFTNDTNLNLDQLAQNLGIDIPDGIEDILPYVTEIVLSIRFLFDIIKVNKDYKGIHATDKTKLYAFKLIMLMSRFGVSSICIPLGGVIGSAIPIPIFGTISGVVAGAWFAGQVNKKLKPKFSELSLWLLGLNDDDLFYLRNKLIVDGIGKSMYDTADGLA